MGSDPSRYQKSSDQLSETVSAPVYAISTRDRLPPAGADADPRARNRGVTMERQPPDRAPRDPRSRPPNAAPLRANQWFAEQPMHGSLRVRLFNAWDRRVGAPEILARSVRSHRSLRRWNRKTGSGLTKNIVESSTDAGRAGLVRNKKTIRLPYKRRMTISTACRK
jgi:hypothetical protein